MKASSRRREKTGHGPADLCADLIDAKLCRANHRRRATKKYSNAMQKLESALLILDQLPALGDIFQCDSGTSFGQRKTIHPKDSRWNVIILIGNFTKRTGLSCQNGAATEFRHICLKQLGKARAYRLADGELNRSSAVRVPPLG